MLAKGDLPTYEKLKRPRTNKFKAVTFSDFLEARVIPSSLYEGALMTTGQWYFNNYKNWFDDFVWQVIRRYKAAMRMRGIDEQIGNIIDEEPGAYFSPSDRRLSKPQRPLGHHIERARDFSVRSYDCIIIRSNLRRSLL